MTKKIILIAILFIGFLFRFNNLNWDSNFHLHPDERFLTMVGNAMVLPKTLSEYFNPAISKLNPVNIGYNFFVYGTFPLILNKIIAVILGNDNYNLFTLQGRFLSAFFDFLIIILVYKTGRLLFSKKNPNIQYPISNIPLYCAFFYAISVYPIQSSHFFTTDTFLNFFMFGSFYLILKFYVLRSTLYLLFSAVFFGLALSSKISALYILPLNLLVLLVFLFIKKRIFKSYKFHVPPFIIYVLRYTLYVILYFIVAYLTLRLASPYYFQNSNFFDSRLSENFISSIKSLKLFTTKDAWYPPGVQWINKPAWALLATTFFVGLGIVNFIVMVIGLIFIANNKLKIINRKKSFFNFQFDILSLIFIWVVGYFIYQSFSFIKSIRYTIYLYPFFAIFGGIGMNVIIYWLLVIRKKFFKSKIFLYVLRSTFYVLFLLWPFLFSTIYLHKNTRVQASEWIYKNLPNNSVILGEHWDDPLPLFIENNFGKSFQVELLPVFDPDTAEKWQKMNKLLGKADYYVLSSNRGWGSIPTVPERYPIMSDFYKKLFNEDCFDVKINCQFKNRNSVENSNSVENCHPELVSGSQFCFKKIKEFLPFYYKFIRYPDSWIEETFTVYDQPTVLIYKKTN